MLAGPREADNWKAVGHNEVQGQGCRGLPGPHGDSRTLATSHLARTSLRFPNLE